MILWYDFLWLRRLNNCLARVVWGASVVWYFIELMEKLLFCKSQEWRNSWIEISMEFSSAEGSTIYQSKLVRVKNLLQKPIWLCGWPPRICCRRRSLKYFLKIWILFSVLLWSLLLAKHVRFFDTSEYSCLQLARGTSNRISH